MEAIGTDKKTHFFLVEIELLNWIYFLNLF